MESLVLNVDVDSCLPIKKRFEMSNKKKKRYKEFLKREKKREAEKLKQKILNDPNTTIEEMAGVLGIKLK